MLNWNWRTFTLFLAVALAVWLWPSIFGGKVLLPLDILGHNPPHVPATAGPVHNGLIGDMLYENYTWKLFQRRALAAGDLPLWNPDIFCGHPLYTTGQASTFYPLNAIFWLVPLPYAYAVFTGVHLLLGGLFTYLFCRRMGVGGFGAAVGGTVFALGGFLTTRLVYPMLLGSAVWLPLMLLWIDWMAAPAQLARKTRGLALGALLFVQPILAGFFEIAFYAYVACGVFTLFRAGSIVCGQGDKGTRGQADGEMAGRRVEEVRGSAVPGRGRAAITFLLKVAAAPVLAGLLAAPQILPFFEVMDRNVRAGQGDYASAQATALDPLELLTVVSPDALGNPAEHEHFRLPERSWEAGSHYFGPKNYVEVGFYFGLLPLAFLLLSPARRNRGFLFAWALLALAVALALVTPVYKLFYYGVPGAEQVRTPFRWMYLAFFAGTFLAGMGAQFWYDRLLRPARTVGRVAAGVVVFICLALVLAVGGLLLVPGPLLKLSEQLMAVHDRIGAVFADPGALAGFLWVNGFRLALFALVAGVCVALGWWRAWTPKAAGWLSLAALTLIAVDLGQAAYGFYTHADPAILQRRPAVVEHMASDEGLFRIGRYGPDKFLYSNLASLYGLQDFGGYDSIILTDYVTFLNGIEHQHLVKYNIVMTIERPGSLDSPLLPLLNLRYLLTRGPIEHPDWEAVPVEGDVKLYRVRPERELPRAFLVDEVRPVASLDEAIREIKSGAVDVFTAATVEVPADTAGRLAETSEASAGTAQITQYQPSLVRVETTASQRALLVLLDVYYPGWNVYIDGNRAEVYRADGVFRGVSVPAGQHTVEFRFEPTSFRVGVIVAGLCFLLLAGLGVAGRSRSGTAVQNPPHPQSEESRLHAPATAPGEPADSPAGEIGS